MTTTCPACLHPTPTEVTLQGCLSPAFTWTHDRPAQATSTKLERNPEAAGSLLGRHTQSGAVLRVGKLRHTRLACSHQAVCSKTNTYPSILDPNDKQNIKHAPFPDLGCLPLRQEAAGLPVQQGGCSRFCFQHSDSPWDSSHLHTKANPGHGFNFCFLTKTHHLC